MRRIVAAIILTLFIAVSILVSNIVINKQCEILKTDIATVENDISKDNFDKAIDEIDKIKNVWHKRKAILSVFSNHGPLDEITIVIEQLNTTVRNNDKSMSLVKCAQISAFIGRIIEEQRIHVESFF